jgi:hypothetical protein
MFKPSYPLVKAVSARKERRSRFDYPNAFIAIWMVAMFVSFGLISSLFDQESLPYYLGQGAFIALFAGAMLYIVRWIALRRKKTVG